MSALRLRRHADGRIALLDDGSKEWTVISPGRAWQGRSLGWAYEEEVSGEGWTEAVVLFPTVEDVERLVRAQCEVVGYEFDDVYEEPDEAERTVGDARDALSLLDRGDANREGVR